MECAANAMCKDGQCYCIEEYRGNPYISCQPECILNSDCDKNKACKSHKCYNPCSNSCGNNAICDVINHIATLFLSKIWNMLTVFRKKNSTQYGILIN